MRNLRNKQTGKTLWTGISPWLIIGVTMVLLVVFIFMTLYNIHKQREHTVKILIEKGDTLIRAFEAGVRTGFMRRHFDLFALQKLLIETAQQPDLDYITVTDTNGIILAESDPYLIGETYGKDLDLKGISESAKISWRLVSNQDGIDTLEVFRQFTPSGKHGMLPPHGPPGGAPPPADEEPAVSKQVIFIGLNMGPVEALRKDAMFNTILISVLLLFVGISGVVSLFLAQGYRSAKVSLSYIKAFSDNLVENMPVGLINLDNRGYIISCNKTAEAVLNLDSGKLIGKDGRDILPKPFHEIISKLGTDAGIIETEIDCPAAEGKMISLEIIASVLEEENGTSPGSVILFRDLSEVRYLKEEISRTQRMASLGTLAAGVAHEIRNPLSSIKGFATYFKERYQDNSEDRETAEIMVHEVDRLNRVISQLLEFSQPLTIEKKPISIQTLIRQTLKLIGGQAGERQIVINANLADLPDAMIDADKIKQAMLNLFLNALGAMEEGGTLTVKVASLNDQTVSIVVSDTGKGIDINNQAHIFDPYFTTKPSGTGLGLSIVHKIIEAHGGEIKVTSTLGKGAVFTILLPISVREGEVS